MCLNNRFKRFLELIRFSLVQLIPDFIILKAHQPSCSWFRDFGTRHQAPKPIIFIFGDTRIPNKIKQNPWNMFGEYYFVNMWLEFWKMWKRRYRFLWGGHVWVSHFYHILWRWGSEKDEDWLNQISKILDMNFISIKKTWNGNLVTFLFSGKGTPAPLNILLTGHWWP